ncbi:MAG: Uma2 family endonuclease [Leptolyngbyaceae cyanobacterium SL_5_9]|nr:Uma2 family endonuclease [Leptolyngbyaceae cyanobacterium SL_5_9]
MPASTTKAFETILEEAKANGIVFPPGDLYSDEPPLETHLHVQQMLLLIKCLDWLWRDRNDYFATGNLTVYYSPRQRKSEDFRGPDFFVVLDTERKPRKSWVVWEEEGKYPNVIVELLSDSTAKTDRGLKKQIYQDIFRTPDYFWFDPDSLEFKGFHLVDGIYHDLQPNEQGQLWSQQLNLYLGVHNRQLRFFTPEGQMTPTPEESAQAAEAMVTVERQQAQAERQRAETERQRAETERQRAETERQRNEKLVAKLRELGIDPDTET